MRVALRRALGGRRGVVVAAVVLLVLVLLGARFVRSLEGDAVATFEVRPGPFVREVEARGSLKAVKATPVLVPPESGRAQKVAFLAKDGAALKKGDTVAEFDPYDAQKEAADGQADLTAARAKIDKAKAEGTKNEKSLGLDRDVAQGGARPRGDLQADRRGPLLAAPDHRVAARPRPLRRPGRRGRPQARREREALLGRARARRDRRGQGPAEGGDRGEGPAVAPHRGPPRRPPGPRAQLARRGPVRGRHPVAGAEDRRAARPLAARGQGVRARGRRRGPQGRARTPGSRSRAGPGRSTRPR